MATKRPITLQSDVREGTDPLVDFYVQLSRLARRSGDGPRAEQALGKALMFTVLYAGSGYDRMTLHRPPTQ